MGARLFRSLCLLMLAGALGGRASAQDGPAAAFTSAADLVVLHVTVTDPSGRHVTGLPPEAFEVTDEGRRQRLTLFSHGSSPAMVDLLVDDSGSMRELRGVVIEAVRLFAEELDPADDVRVWLFAGRVRQVWPESASEGPTVTLPGRVAREFRAVGMSAFHDAVAHALAHERDRRVRRVLIVVGDGADNASQLGFAEVRALARTSNAVIHAIGIVDPVDEDARPGRLRELAKETGGRAVFPRTPAELADAFSRISRDIRHAYTLAYPMPAEGPDLRRVRVRVTAPGQRRLTARTRAAYRTSPAN